MDVETSSPLSAGQTVVDIWHQSSRPKNCTVCMVRTGCWLLLLLLLPLLLLPASSSPCSAAATCCVLPCPADCLQEMDVARFWDLLIDAVHAADQHSPLNGGGGGGGDSHPKQR